ncbi:metal ABC transporter permease [Methanospirillum sp.]|uniref:metal ABC transporter permease n=1 Tax=Methanospirillum sp. TaxID=45200 RepID=UPI00359FD15A
MIEAFTFDFFRSAILAGLMASVICGIIGSYIYVKHMISVAGGISHAAFGGIGLGYLLGVDPLAGAFWFTLGIAALIWGLVERAKEHIDTLIGAFWAGGMAFGILCLSFTPGYTPDLFSYLFGNILLVTPGHLVMTALLGVFVMLLFFILYPVLQALAFDPEYAAISNLPVRSLHLLVLALIAVSVVVLIQVVGIILVIALLTLPAAIARPFSKTLKGMMIRATGISMLLTTGGIMFSWIFDIPSGSSIILLGVLVYFQVLGGTELAGYFGKKVTEG